MTPFRSAMSTYATPYLVYFNPLELIGHNWFGHLGRVARAG
jgi:hypothetical protein